MTLLIQGTLCCLTADFILMSPDCLVYFEFSILGRFRAVFISSLTHVKSQKAKK